VAVVGRGAPHRQERPWTTPRRSWWLAWAVFVPVAVLRAGTLAESDTFWEVRTGLFIWARHRIPTTDPFSWTVAGRSWDLNSWGFDALAGAAYRLAGLAAVALACAALVLVAVAVSLVLARRLGAAAPVSAAVLLATMPLLLGWLSARPQLVDYVMLPSYVLLLRPPAARGRSLPVVAAAVALLTVVWANLHAAALVALAAVVATAGVLALWRRGEELRGTVVLAGVTGVALLVNPRGAGLLAQAVAVRRASTGTVEEWQHLDPSDVTQVVMLLLGAAALPLAWRRREAALVGPLAVLLAGSVAAVRFLPLLTLLAVPVLAAALSGDRLLGYLRSRAVVLVPGAALLVVALVVIAVPAATHPGRPEPGVYPSTVQDAVPRGCRVWNSYLLGGWLMLERPDVTVSLDSRNDLYGAGQVRAADRLVNGGGDPRSALAGAGCVLVPSGSGLATRLETDPTWRRAAGEPAATLFVRAG
jgi:hypothetical protein